MSNLGKLLRFLVPAWFGCFSTTLVRRCFFFWRDRCDQLNLNSSFFQKKKDIQQLNPGLISQKISVCIILRGWNISGIIIAVYRSNMEWQTIGVCCRVLEWSLEPALEAGNSAFRDGEKWLFKRLSDLQRWGGMKSHGWNWKWDHLGVPFNGWCSMWCPEFGGEKRIMKFIPRYPVILSDSGWGVQSPL